MRSTARRRSVIGRRTAISRQIEVRMAAHDDSDLSSRLDGYFRTLADLCDRLEEIADRLPDQVDRQHALHVARSVSPIVWHAHEFEETVLFPLLAARFPHDAPVKDALKDLQFEHWEDEMFAEELAEALAGFIGEMEPRNPEALGYMLRGFFGGMRRHLAFEKAHILPLVKEIEARGHA